MLAALALNRVAESAADDGTGQRMAVVDQRAGRGPMAVPAVRL
jgi:hypothetical protein